MENFIYNEDVFCSDIGDLLSHLEIDEEDVPNSLDDDWTADIAITKIEPLYMLDANKLDEILASVFDERFPDDWSVGFEKQILNAIKESVDFDKLKSLLPQMCYPSGEIETVTKKDLIEYCNPATP